MSKTIKLTLRHIAETEDSTVSALETPTGELLCYIIEDGHRDKKVWGETRIPAGLYEMIQKFDGTFLSRYKNAFGHTFVPQLLNVPNFVGILLHIGNFIKDTAGCLLPCTTYEMSEGNYMGLQSEIAYLKLISYLAGVFGAGYRVFIEISREIPEPEPEPTPPKTQVPEAPTEELQEEENVPQEVPSTVPPGCRGSVALLVALLTLAFYFGY